MRISLSRCGCFFPFSFPLLVFASNGYYLLRKRKREKKPTALSNHLYKRNFNFGEVLGKALTDTSTSTSTSTNISISKGISFSIPHRHSAISLSHPLCMFIHQIDHRAYVPRSLSLCMCSVCAFIVYELQFLYAWKSHTAI